MIITILTVFSVVTAVTPTMIPLSIPSTQSASSVGNIATNATPTGLCVAPAGNAVANGVPVQLSSCPGDSPWLYDDVKKTLTVTGTNQCLDVRDGVNADGTRLQTWQCTGGPNQQFQLVRDPRNPASVTIHWVGTNKCIDVRNGVFNPGTPLQIWDCNGIINQSFSFPVTPPYIWFSTTAHPGFCIGIPNFDNGAPLQIFNCERGPSLRFTPVDGGFHIGGFAIDLTNAVQANGNKLQVWTAFPGNTNQHWIYDAVNKAIRLTANPNKCIDVTNGVFASGTRLQVWDCTFGPNQQFDAQETTPH